MTNSQLTNTQTTTQVMNTFSIRKDIFDSPGLDIYTQMTYIVLSLYTNNHSLPAVTDLSQKGRMNKKQVTRSLQTLVELKMLPHKIFREITGDFGDDRLSWAAKGLLLYCKSNPNVTLTDLFELADQSNDDEHTIRAAIQDLKRYGYLDELTSLNKELTK